MSICPDCTKKESVYTFPRIVAGGGTDKRHTTMRCEDCAKKFYKISVGNIERSVRGTANLSKAIVNHYDFSFEGASLMAANWLFVDKGFAASRTRKHSPVAPNLKGVVKTVKHIVKLIDEGEIEVGENPKFRIYLTAFGMEDKPYEYEGDIHGWLDFIRESEDEFVHEVNEEYGTHWKSALKAGTR